MSDAIKRAVELAGGAAKVAALFNISRISVYEWVHKGRIPAERCPALERANDGQVRCEDMRPDVDWSFLRANPEEKQKSQAAA